MKWVFIIGCPRSGTSYLTKCLHASGLPMWVDEPGTCHLEEPSLRAVNYPELHPGLPDRLSSWKCRTEERGIFPCGAKHPRLLRHPRVLREVFPDSETRYVICVRSKKPTVDSLHKLTGVGLGICEVEFERDQSSIKNWPEAHIFNYEGDIGDEEGKLNLFLGARADVVSGWNPKIP